MVLLASTPESAATKYLPSKWLKTCGGQKLISEKAILPSLIPGVALAAWRNTVLVAGKHLHARSYPKDSFILITTCWSTSNSFVEVIICSCLISKSTCHLLRTGTWIRLVLVLWGGCIVNRNSGLGCWEYWVKSIGFFSIMWLYYYSKRSLKKWYS